MVKQVLRYWRAAGIRVMAYIDDLIFFATSYEEVVELMARVVCDLEVLGWVIA